MCQVCANCPGGVEDPPGRLIVAGMVLGELEDGDFGDLMAALPQSQTSVQAGRPRSGPAGAEGLDYLAKEHHATDVGHGGPAPTASVSPVKARGCAPKRHPFITSFWGRGGAVCRCPFSAPCPCVRHQRVRVFGSGSPVFGVLLSISSTCLRLKLRSRSSMFSSFAEDAGHLRPKQFDLAIPTTVVRVGFLRVGGAAAG
jgi:hypothetical protein